ncbi:MAG: ATP-binding protein [Pseudomonadales bacterium]
MPRAPNGRGPDTESQLGLIADFAAALLSAEQLDDVLWLIVDRVISALEFEDCIVYWLPPGGDHLIQRAAYGPKNPSGREIKNPITIPLGQGIVGASAMIQQPLRIHDAAEDPRYILDDQFRHSELSVPIVFEGRVLAVIDSEHTEIGFFSAQDEAFLLTIANMTAARLAQMQRSERLNHFAHELNASESVKNFSDAGADMDNSEHRSERLQTDIISRMSHEMKTPLNAILGMSQMLLDERHPNVITEPLKLINQAAADLDHTISNLLTGLNADSDQSDLSDSEIDFRLFLTNIVEKADQHFGGQTTLFADNLPDRARFRSIIVEQILLCLLSNAIKFSPLNEAKLIVSLKDYQEKIGICFTITDDGPGISTDDRKRIFEPFFKAGDASATRDKGLGLTVARALSRRIDAELAYIPQGRSGSTFELTISAQFSSA